MEDEDDAVDSMRVKRSRMTHHREIRETTLSLRGTMQTSIPTLHGWTEYFNIGTCQDELDPAILEKLSAPSAIATTSVHKYWTSTWAKTMDIVDLLELLKFAKMSTAQSHVLN
ncbi:hypothetical protein Fot_39180 [Forsythia ovata]|uniref:Uncharacterized protein n=1 Tax=Forsythia ovata TaxID=205694 RepID=A0ABD1S3V1_9LAMI